MKKGNWSKKNIIKTSIGLAVIGITGTAAIVGYKLIKKQKIFPLFDFEKKDEIKKDRNVTE